MTVEDNAFYLYREFWENYLKKYHPDVAELPDSYTINRNRTLRSRKKSFLYENTVKQGIEKEIYSIEKDRITKLSLTYIKRLKREYKDKNFEDELLWLITYHILGNIVESLEEPHIETGDLLKIPETLPQCMVKFIPIVKQLLKVLSTEEELKKYFDISARKLQLQQLSTLFEEPTLITKSAEKRG